MKVRHHILVVDDSTTVLGIERRMLTDAGFEVATAQDGEAAIRAALSRVPSLIVLDLVMPVLGGIETCRRLRAERETASVPIIVVSTRGDSDAVKSAIAAGASDYLPKPFTAEVLVAKVQALLARAAP